MVEASAGAQQAERKPSAIVLGAGLAASPADAMRMALELAGVRPSDVDAVYAAAGGYGEDELEARALIEVFGDQGVAVTAIKGLVGETLGASGALNAAAALASLRNGILPATPGAEARAFPELGLVSEARRIQPKRLLVNAGGPGSGCRASLLLASPGFGE